MWMQIIIIILFDFYMQTPLAELKPSLKLKWRKGNNNMPYSMAGNIQAVVIGSDVYVGGGDNLNAGTVMVYSLQTGTWRTLPPYENRIFGMAVVNNQLVLVGGVSTSTGKSTNEVGLWDEELQTWTHPFPVMPTARRSGSVIFYQKCLVVAGGNDGPVYSNKVELLDISSSQWYEGSPLPRGWSCISSAVSGNMWYLSGGYSSPNESNKLVFAVCLDVLISQAVLQSALPSTISPWQTLTELPVERPTVLIIRGSLLAVGGRFSSAIHLYQPTNRSWVKVDDLPTQRQRCACIVLSSGEIFVAGGYDITFKNVCSVYITSIA